MYYFCLQCINEWWEINLLSIQVALEYAQKKYDDFAAIVQPFFSNAKSDNFTVDFLSYVSPTTCSAIHNIYVLKLPICLVIMGNICNVVSSATLPVGLLPSFCPCPSEHGQSSLEQHAHTCCKKENFVWFHWDLCVPHKLNSFVHLLAIAYILYIYIMPVNLYNYILCININLWLQFGCMYLCRIFKS